MQTDVSRRTVWSLCAIVCGASKAGSQNVKFERSCGLLVTETGGEQKWGTAFVGEGEDAAFGKLLLRSRCAF